MLNPALLTFILLFGTISSQAQKEFHLDGSDTNYLSYPSWNVNTNLSFEFSTKQPYSLLLYTDDNGIDDFLLFKLVDGFLRLTHNGLDGRTQVDKIGVNRVDDGLWHQLGMEVVNGTTSSTFTLIVTLDSLPTSVKIPGTFKMSGFHLKFENRVVFIGGLPQYLKTKLDGLTHPFAFFAKRFQGSVRNFTCDGQGRELDGVSNDLVISTPAWEGCEFLTVCRNGGRCIITGKGESHCNCKYTGYDGTYCEIEKTKQCITLGRNQYFGINMTMRDAPKGHTRVSQREEVFFRFQTNMTFHKDKLTNNLQFFIHYDEGSNYMEVTIHHGRLALSVDIGGKVSSWIISESKCDDGRWHRVRIVRRVTRNPGENMYTYDYTTEVDNFTKNLRHLDSTGVFSVNSVRFGRHYSGLWLLLPMATISIQKASYQMDNMAKLDILEMVRDGHPLAHSSYGMLNFTSCQEDPIHHPEPSNVSDETILSSGDGHDNRDNRQHSGCLNDDDEDCDDGNSSGSGFICEDDDDDEDCLGRDGGSGSGNGDGGEGNIIENGNDNEKTWPTSVHPLSSSPQNNNSEWESVSDFVFVSKIPTGTNTAPHPTSSSPTADNKGLDTLSDLVTRIPTIDNKTSAHPSPTNFTPGNSSTETLSNVVTTIETGASSSASPTYSTPGINEEKTSSDFATKPETSVPATSSPPDNPQGWTAKDFEFIIKPIRPNPETGTSTRPISASAANSDGRGNLSRSVTKTPTYTGSGGVAITNILAKDITCLIMMMMLAVIGLLLK